MSHIYGNNNRMPEAFIVGKMFNESIHLFVRSVNVTLNVVKMSLFKR